MQSGNYCDKHAHWLEDGEEACRLCQDDIVAQAPQMASFFRRQRFWSRATYVWSVAVAVIAFLAIAAFRAYREYVIWSR